MIKKIGYILLVFNIGLFFYFGFNNFQFVNIVEIPGNIIYTACYDIIEFFVPQTLGTPYIILSNFLLYNMLLCIFLLIAGMPLWIINSFKRNK